VSLEKSDAKIYESRWLLYVDILGWRELIAAGVDPRLLEIVERIHRVAEGSNENVRQHYIARDGKYEEWAPGIAGKVKVNPLFLQHQFGAFSDHFVFSMPATYGAWFLNSASKLVIDLLHSGVLTRGAAVIGDLYHRDNVIFGPALVEAAEIEAREGIFPRILLSPAVIKELDNWESVRASTLVIEDILGRRVVNPFSLPFTGGTEEMLDSFVDLNYHLREIRTTIEREISALEAANRHAHAEKWRYLWRQIDGPILTAEPRLRPYWDSATHRDPPLDTST
jgi:hypothetical protein